ncbi:MAG: hypothetical protein QG652_523 [Pseudomonadota bacterium]|nr:hypothetical protein [Pseudomonadota bacterium]
MNTFERRIGGTQATARDRLSLWRRKRSSRAADTGSIPQNGIELTALLQPVPHTASATVLFQMVALGQVAEMLLQGVAAGSG